MAMRGASLSIGTAQSTASKSGASAIAMRNKIDAISDKILKQTLVMAEKEFQEKKHASDQFDIATIQDKNSQQAAQRLQLYDQTFAMEKMNEPLPGFDFMFSPISSKE